MMKVIKFAVVVCFVISCDQKENSTQRVQTADDKSEAFEVRMTVEHDPNAFTQGLVYHQGNIIESTGGDDSWIAKYDIASGQYEKKVSLDQNYFGEGITILHDKLYQLTWKNNVGFVYDVNTFEKIGEFTYDFEGWGITHDNHHLIISDGTDKLHYFDTLNWQKVSTKSVKNYNRKTSNLNELEFIEGFIYANQWQTNRILKLATGPFEVFKVLDLVYLAKAVARINPQADVLNGIAYNPDNQDIFITGKLWPRSYILRLK